jgi:hypothetical protein
MYCCFESRRAFSGSFSGKRTNSSALLSKRLQSREISLPCGLQVTTSLTSGRSRKYACWKSRYCDKKMDSDKIRMFGINRKLALMTWETSLAVRGSRSTETHSRRRASKSTLRNHLDMSLERLSIFFVRLLSSLHSCQHPQSRTRFAQRVYH